MVNVGLSWLPALLILVQLAFVLWFISTLGEIKLYLREIRDILRQTGRNL